MPQGNHHYTPSGIWFQSPGTTSYKRLLLRSFGHGLLVVAGISGLWGIRHLTYFYTYPNFIGKTITYGTSSINTHEPASTEYIDQLKRDMEAKRQRKYKELYGSK